MKKHFFLVIIFLLFVNTSCKEKYRDEIFNGQYDIIYGQWQHLIITNGITDNDNYSIRFTPIGKFSYNNGKTGIIKIREQNEYRLVLDFNSLFPKVTIAKIKFQGNDTMRISDTGDDMAYRLFVRISK
jgi:hypothetical protein